MLWVVSIETAKTYSIAELRTSLQKYVIMQIKLQAGRKEGEENN